MERLTEESNLELQGEGATGGVRVAHARSVQIPKLSGHRDAFLQLIRITHTSVNVQS